MVRTMVPAASPSDLPDHCRRVGAIANLIAHHLFLPTEEKMLLEAACLYHHTGEQAPAEVRDVLVALGKPAAAGPVRRKLGPILRLSDAFDNEYQAEPFRRRHAQEILAALRGGVDRGMWPKRILDALEECTQPPLMPSPGDWSIPVFPQAALQTLDAIGDPQVSIPQVVDAARRDPATAGAIMQLANSALYGQRGEVSTLQMAVARLGFETSRKLVTSLAMRPLLFLPRLESLWPHSIEVADLAEQLAGRARGIDRGEAYLAGLLHDVGRIALRATALYDAARLQGLEQSGCPAVYAEDLILRTDHAVLGGQIAVLWRLPEHLVSAIRQHHRPEAAQANAAGRLAYLLYLAEHLAGGREDLPSSSRVALALNGLGLTKSDLDGCAPSDIGSWLAAA